MDVAFEDDKRVTFDVSGSTAERCNKIACQFSDFSKNNTSGSRAVVRQFIFLKSALISSALILVK